MDSDTRIARIFTGTLCDTVSTPVRDAALQTQPRRSSQTQSAAAHHRPESGVIGQLQLQPRWSEPETMMPSRLEASAALLIPMAEARTGCAPAQSRGLGGLAHTTRRHCEPTCR